LYADFSFLEMTIIFLGLSSVVQNQATVAAIRYNFFCAILVIPNARRNLQQTFIAAQKKISASISQPFSIRIRFNK